MKRVRIKLATFFDCKATELGERVRLKGWHEIDAVIHRTIYDKNKWSISHACGLGLFPGSYPTKREAMARIAARISDKAKELGGKEELLREMHIKISDYYKRMSELKRSESGEANK